MRPIYLVLLVLFLAIVGIAALAVWYFVLQPAIIAGMHEPVGTVLVYEADADQPTSAVRMEQAVTAIDRRLNPPGVPPKAEVKRLTDGRLEIGVYGRDPDRVAQVKSRVGRLGTLEFRILANERDHRAIIEQASRDSERRVFDAKGNLLAWWVPIQPGNEKDFPYPEIAKRDGRANDRLVKEVLVVNDPFNVTGAFLKRVSRGTDPRGRPCVAFDLDSRGAKAFSQLTGRNLPDKTADFRRKLGIILDGNLHSAPAITGTIYDSALIEGTFTQDEVDDLVAVLNAGSLPARLKLVEEHSASD